MPPQTRAEATGYRETSLHRHVMEFLAAVDKRHLTLSSFGTSPGGRDMPLVVMSAHGVKTPAGARKAGLPVVLVINGIHAGEVEGKEASMMLMRDLQQSGSDLLAQMTLVIVPLFNPDGNDAIDPANRKLNLPKLEGQIGPELVGTRVNAKGINLNRDYMRQASEEMRALQSRVAQVWQPDLTIDTHATNGSVHRMQMTYDVPHTIASGRAEPILYMREQMMPAVQAALARDHAVLAGWYGNFVEDERALDARTDADPSAPVREGWMTYTHHPRFGSNYRGLTNRLDLLLECYSYLEFPERVRTTYATLLEALRHVAGHRDEVLDVVARSRAPRDQVAIRYRLEAFDAPITIPTRTPRTPDGAPSEVAIRHVANFVGTTTVGAPAGLPRAGRARRAPRAPRPADRTGDRGARGRDRHRHRLRQRRRPQDPRVRERGDLHVQWKRATRTAPAGSRLVRTDHSLGAIAVYLCEPESDDSAIENAVIAAPDLGGEIPVWRITD